MINKVLINKLSEKYTLKIKIINDATIYVTSKFDDWYVEITEHKLILKHNNKKYHTNHYHVHKTYDNDEKNYDKIFKSIYEHDDFLINKWSNKYFRVNRLFEQIAMAR